MNNHLKILIIVPILILGGCETEEILNPDVVHDEHTVVQAEIIPDKLFPGVKFTKTLPLGIPYSIEQAELKNVKAYLILNGIKTIPLHYVAEGIYKPRYEFYVEEGDEYELFALADEKYIYCRTIIPYNPEVTNTTYNRLDFYMDADVISKSDEVYGAIWIMPGNPPAIANDYFSISSPTSVPNSRAMVRTSPIPEKYRTPAYNGQRYIQVFAFDKTFNKYFNSRTSGHEIGDPFIQGGGSIEWNVQGEKVIGMFIGVTPGNIIQVL
jgi:hypothetical protein